jgi:hypothetical protein
MQTLAQRASALLQEFGHGETTGSRMNELMTEARAILSEQAQFTATPAQIERARAEYGSEEIEIDGGEVSTSPSDGGTWVSAWVWLADTEGEG